MGISGAESNNSYPLLWCVYVASWDAGLPTIVSAECTCAVYMVSVMKAILGLRA